MQKIQQSLAAGRVYEYFLSLFTSLRAQTEKAEKLDRIIWTNLEDIGYGR